MSGPEIDAGATLLVIGQASPSLSALQSLLMRPGLRVLTAHSAAEALAVLQADEVALIVVDGSLMLPDALPVTPPLLIVQPADSPATLPPWRHDAAPVDILPTPIDERLLQHKLAVFLQLHAQQRRLRDQAEALQRAQILSGTLVSVFVHDLRSPLTAIVASAELVRRSASDELLRQAGERIQRSARRMARSLTQLLDVVEIRSGRLQLDRARGDLGEAVAAAMAETKQTMPSASIEYQVQGDAIGCFDAERLTRVITNLLFNALLNGTHGQPVQVLLDGSAAASLTVRIVNAGSLPAEHQPCSFEPATSRAHGLPPGPGPGLGLGLGIVEQFVRAHGGEVSGRSVDGVTVFEFSIPRGG